MPAERKSMNQYNIGDYVQVHLAGADAGSLGDGSVVQIVSIQMVGERLLYTGVYDTDCGGSSIQFTGSECTVVKHTSN